MSCKVISSVGASVRARLQLLARQQGDDFQLVLLRYVNERLLYRLTQSAHAQHFVLKGAALFTLWSGHPHRATRDLDLLGFGDSHEAHLRGVFHEILSQEVEDDGVQFDVDSLEVGPIVAVADDKLGRCDALERRARGRDVEDTGTAAVLGGVAPGVVHHFVEEEQPPGAGQ
jgi:hypothetical protein